MGFVGTVKSLASIAGGFITGGWQGGKEATKQELRNNGYTTLSRFVPVEEMRYVGDWARTYTWNVTFSGNNNGISKVVVPRLFQQWFPATDLSFDLAGVDGQDFSPGNLGLCVPKSSPSYKLSITLLDEYRLIMMDWLNMWMTKVVNIREGTTLPIKDASCLCHIVLFDSDDYNIYYGGYYVFPTGTLQVVRNSASEIVSYQVEFNVTGMEENLIDEKWNYESLLDKDWSTFHDYGHSTMERQYSRKVFRGNGKY